MGVYFDGDISGNGSAFWSGNNGVLYIAIDATAFGPDVTRPTNGVSDQILRFGWYSLGDQFDIGDGNLYERWRDPVFINFAHLLWTPDPSGAGGGGTTLLASRVRWALGPGSTAHLHVFGV